MRGSRGGLDEERFPSSPDPVSRALTRLMGARILAFVLRVTERVPFGTRTGVARLRSFLGLAHLDVSPSREAPGARHLP
jgi:hypothetical protein